jgi:hypothetical protein
MKLSIPRILLNPKFHYRIHNSLLIPILSQKNPFPAPPPPAFYFFKELTPQCQFSCLFLVTDFIPKHLSSFLASSSTFPNMLNFYGEELLAPCSPLKLEVYPFSAVGDCLFNIFAATLHIWGPFLHPQPEDAPCNADRDSLITVTGTH